MKVSSPKVMKIKCPHLVSIFLEGLSTHEVGGDQLNYISQHSESMQRSKEEIDNLRVIFFRFFFLAFFFKIHLFSLLKQS